MFSILFVCVFFFKQKTAYEMRLSDWSSDVCSSDLGADDAAELDQRHARLGRDAADLGTQRLDLLAVLLGELLPAALAQPIEALEPVGIELLAEILFEEGLALDTRIERIAQQAALRPRQQIGRAPCRERVCKYV